MKTFFKRLRDAWLVLIGKRYASKYPVRKQRNREYRDVLPDGEGVQT